MKWFALCLALCRCGGAIDYDGECPRIPADAGSYTYAPYDGPHGTCIYVAPIPSRE